MPKSKGRIWRLLALIVAGLIGKYNGQWNDHPQAAWAGVGFIFAFMFFFGIGAVRTTTGPTGCSVTPRGSDFSMR